MAERKKIGSISYITDTETGMYRIGEVDGGFSEDELRHFIERFGHEELCAKLSYLSFQVWEAVRRINSERQMSKIGSNESVS